MFRQFVKNPRSALIAGTLLSAALVASPSAASELSNRQETAYEHTAYEHNAYQRAAFETVPRLIRSAASSNTSNAPASYHFTVTVPENAGESLQAVKIVQQPGVQKIEFNMNRSQAFIGDSFAGGPNLSLASTGGLPSAKGEVTIVFDSPVPPGSTVTVSVRVKENPRFGGTLLSDGFFIAQDPIFGSISITSVQSKSFSRVFIGRHRTITFTVSAISVRFTKSGRSNKTLRRLQIHCNALKLQPPSVTHRLPYPHDAVEEAREGGAP